MNRRNFLTASAGALIMGKQASGEVTDEKVMSSGKLAETLSACPETRVTVAYQEGANIQTTYLLECNERGSDNYMAGGVRYADGCKIHQTDKSTTKMFYPRAQTDSSNCAIVTTSSCENTSVLDLNRLDIVAISTSTLNLDAEQTRYLRCNEGWKVVPSDTKLLAIGPNMAGHF